jgi:limonene-1,2-epoxide hydrolase
VTWPNSAARLGRKVLLCKLKSAARLNKPARTLEINVKFKNSSWLLLVLLGLSSLPAWADTDEEKLATAQKMVDAWNRMDWEAVYALFSEDAVMHSVMLEPIVGRENIRQRFSRFTPGLERIELQLAHIGIVDDVVVMERVDDFVYQGKHSRVPVAGILEINNGLVTEWREYYDHAMLAEALLSETALKARAAATEQAIRDLTQKLQTDWNGGNMDAYLDAFWRSEELSLMFGNQAVRGWQAMAEMFRGNWATEQAMGDFSVNNVVVTQLSSDTVIASGAFTHVFPDETVEGSFTHVWKLLEDGQWRIAHEHTSRKSTAPAHE